MSRRWAVLILIFFGILISYVDRGNLGIAAVEIMREFGFSPALMGTLLSCFFWTYGAAQFPAGMVVDRFGIRRTYATAFLAWSLASASIGLAVGLGSILTSRLVLGLAEAVGPLASIAFIRRNFSPSEQGLPTAIYIAGQSLGPAAGAWAGTVLLEALGWRSVFIITGLAALVWLPPWWLLAPRGGAKAPAASHATPPAPEWSRVLMSAGFWVLTGCVFLQSYFWYFMLTWAPAYLRLTHHYGAAEMGRVMAIPMASMTVTTIAGGVLADRTAQRWSAPVRARLLFSAGGYLGASSFLLLRAAPDRSWVLPILLVSMCCVGVANSNFWALAQAAAPSKLIGRAIGYLNMVGQAAGAAAPLITGWLLGPRNDFTVAIAIAGLCPLITGLALWITGAARMEGLRDALAPVGSAR